MQQFITNQDCMNFKDSTFQKALEVLEITATSTDSKMAPNYDFVGDKDALEFMLKKYFDFSAADIEEMEMIEEHIEESMLDRMMNLCSIDQQNKATQAQLNIMNDLRREGFEMSDIKIFLLNEVERLFKQRH